VTSAGRMLRLDVLDLPALPPTATAPSLSGGAPVAEFLALDTNERVRGLASLDGTAGAGLALGTAQGVVKRVLPDAPANRAAWELIALRPGDSVVGSVELSSGSEDLVFVSSDAQLLRFPASAVRPQGRAAGGMAGARLSAGAEIVFFGAVDAARNAAVVTIAGSGGALPGTEPGTVKVAPYSEYPAKGRATGGVRCHRFLRGEDQLLFAYAGVVPLRAAAPNGVPLDLPAAQGKRDGSGIPLPQPLAAVAGPPATT
jgi:DNA gyrase subunit A